MTKKEDEIQALDPGEKQIRRRVRHNSLNSGTPNFSPDPDGPAEIDSDDSETLTETHGSHDDNEESSNSRCHTWLKHAALRGDDMEKSRVMPSSHCTIFKAVESLLFSHRTTLCNTHCHCCVHTHTMDPRQEVSHCMTLQKKESPTIRVVPMDDIIVHRDG